LFLRETPRIEQRKKESDRKDKESAVALPWRDFRKSAISTHQ
jgi:hypothetical protein